MSNETLLICNCGSNEHQIIVTKEYYETYPYLFLTIHLAKIPWYKRIIHAVKYAFGYRCTFGDFDEFEFNVDTACKFIDALHSFVNDMADSEEDDGKVL